MRLAAGDRVRLRGEQWTVEDAAAFEASTRLDLSTDRPEGIHRQSFFVPFDRPVLVEPSRAIQVVSRRRWMHRLAGHLASTRGVGHLRAAEAAGIEILPFQLEPALAMAAGTTSRILLADEVGLGKTIQAGLVLAELQQRGFCDRALIVVPAALRGQWRQEIRDRFQIDATIADAATIAELAESLPPGVNPWAIHPALIASIDFIKQPEVHHALQDITWDLLVVDEAHHAASGSQRHDVVFTLAHRARRLLLLTATPHSGDEAAYRSLCDLGRTGKDDALTTFRRTRAAVRGGRPRRVRLLRVRQGANAMTVHRDLLRYTSALWHIAGKSGSHALRLVATILAKRSFSSMQSLRISLERRLEMFSPAPPHAAQPPLPLWSDEEDPSDEAVLPAVMGFERHEEERGAIEQLLHAARVAEAADAKLAAVSRLLGRIREPAVVFTEYRDTLQALATAVAPWRPVVLHGGQNSHERRAAVMEFTSGRSRLLVATDAGAEGLNLQARCRLVINVELPWSPTRLEQRIGRVDRIGQSRTVHVINLLAADTAEDKMLSGLLHKLDRIRLSEIEIAACVINGTAAPQPSSAGRPPPDSAVSRDARAEAERLHHWRASSAARRLASCDTRHVTAIPRRGTAPSLVALFRARIVNDAGRLVEDTMVAIRADTGRAARVIRARDVRRLAETLVHHSGARLRERARAAIDRRCAALAVDIAGRARRAAARERALVSHARRRPVQAGLFDRRELKLRDATDERQAHAERDGRARAKLHAADAELRLAGDPRLVLLLLRC